MRHNKRNSLFAGLTAAAAITGTLMAGTAGAAIQTGWVGPIPATAGYTYLDSSTINNAPLSASSKIYTYNGAVTPETYMGVRARLFKSGVLCQIVGYQYNADPASLLEVATPAGANCGSGSYNSNGFVTVFDPAKGYQEYVTFPTNPLNYTAPKTAVSPSATALKSGENEKGQTLGSGANAKTDNDLPDLVQAFTDTGKAGYVKASDISAKPLAPAAVKALPKKTVGGNEVYHAAAHKVPVFAADGTTTIGSFTIS